MQSGVCGKPRFVVGKKCREAAKAIVGGRGYEQSGSETGIRGRHYCALSLKINMKI